MEPQLLLNGTKEINSPVASRTPMSSHKQFLFMAILIFETRYQNKFIGQLLGDCCLAALLRVAQEELLTRRIGGRN